MKILSELDSILGEDQDLAHRARWLARWNMTEVYAAIIKCVEKLRDNDDVPGTARSHAGSYNSWSITFDGVGAYHFRVQDWPGSPRNGIYVRDAFHNGNLVAEFTSPQEVEEWFQDKIDKQKALLP